MKLENIFKQRFAWEVILQVIHVRFLIKQGSKRNSNKTKFYAVLFDQLRISF